jgi:hypothetical protein
VNDIGHGGLRATVSLGATLFTGGNLAIHNILSNYFSSEVSVLFKISPERVKIRLA